MNEQTFDAAREQFIAAFVHLGKTIHEAIESVIVAVSQLGTSVWAIYIAQLPEGTEPTLEGFDLWLSGLGEQTTASEGE